MTTVIAVLNRAARQCSVTPPTAWAGATRPEHVELRDDFLPETVENIRDRIDLPSPIGKQTVISGDGSESYSLPADFARLQRDPLAVYETTTLRRGGTPISTDGAWTHVNQIGGAGTFRYYKIEGYEGAHTIKFESDLATGASVTVSYVSNVWCASSGGSEQSAFADENDIILLPRRVLETGIVYRFRARRGLDFTTVLAQYEAELARMANDVRQAKVIPFGPGGDDWRVMRVPVPDYIPSS